jgi:hypothetical protein
MSSRNSSAEQSFRARYESAWLGFECTSMNGTGSGPGASVVEELVDSAV